MRKSSIFVALLLLFAGSIWAQAAAPAQEEAPAATTPAQAYYLNNIKWNVNGRTKPWALMIKIKMTGKEEWASLDAFKTWVLDTTQLMMNERVLDSAKIDYTLDAPRADGAIAINLVISIKDTWNIIALPKPLYTSNDGLDISVRARDYNFLGTLEPLKINFGYQLDNDALDQKKFSAATYYGDIILDIPFQALEKDWTFDFENSFAWTEDKKFQYTNKTGVSVDLPWKTTTFTVGAYQYYYLNPENGDDYKAEYGKYYDDTWYLQNSLTASWEIPTGIIVGKFGKLTYTPATSFDYNYRPLGEIGEERIGPSATVSQSLAFSRVDWIGNFRRGVSASLDNSNTWNFHKESWDNSVSGTFIAHAEFWKYFGASTKLYGIYHFQETDTSAGANLRGILDDDVSADALATINVDLPVSLIRFKPYEWTGIKAFKPFQFEQLWSPFLDGAVGYRKDGGHLYNGDDLLYCGGLEVTTFPSMFRSLFLRISCGFDLSYFSLQTAAIKDTLHHHEIYIGLDQQY